MKYLILSLILFSSPLRADLIDEIIDDEPAQEETKPKDKSLKNKNINRKAKESKRNRQRSKVDYNNEKPRKAPIKINSSGTSTFDKKKNLIVLNKDVIITQEDLRLESDKAKVFIEKVDGEEVVEKAVLLGGVHVSKFDKEDSKMIKARGDTATFYNNKQKVELNGNARLWKGGHLIKGRKIIYDIKTSMISVDEARGVVQPGELENE